MPDTSIPNPIPCELKADSPAFHGSQAEGLFAQPASEAASQAAPPFVLELSVRRGRVLRFSAVEWAMLLRLAFDFGWLPEGVRAIHSDGSTLETDRWYGLHRREAVAYRAISANDAAAMGRALARAASIVARESDAAMLAAASGIERWSAPAASGGRATSSALQYFIEQGVATYWLDQVAGDLHDAATLVVHGAPTPTDAQFIAQVFLTPKRDPWAGGGAKLHLCDTSEGVEGGFFGDGADEGTASLTLDEMSADGGSDEQARAAGPTADDVIARLDADPEFRAALEEEVARARAEDEDPLARHFRGDG